MRYIILVLLLFCGLLSCQDEKSSFDFPISEEGFSFRAIPGGAVMYYKLPNDSDIFALNVRYMDAHGEECLKVGGYGSDSLILDGFNAAEKNVPARISFVNERNEESQAVEVTFDTQESATYAFFNDVEVLPYWDGFQVKYKTSEQVSGMVHVFYLGTNPLTQQPDTILVKSSPIAKGENTLFFPLQQAREMNTVIVRTEDFRGYRVRQKVWENVEAYQVEKLNLTASEFIDVRNLSIENDEDMSGIKYLFDGDTKGSQRMTTYETAKVYTFVAGPDAVGAPFIINLKENKIPARIRLYGLLKMQGLSYSGVNWGTGVPDSPLGSIWGGSITAKIPCAITVYGGNEENGDESSWTKLGSFYQSPSTAEDERWCAQCISAGLQVTNIDELNAADPAYIEVLFPETATTYRYLKLVVDDTFYANSAAYEDSNSGNYITIHELEIYTKKD